MTYHRRKPKPRKWPWVLLALAIVGALVACEALSQPPYQPQPQYAQPYQPAYTYQPLGPPIYARPLAVRNWVRVNVLGWPPVYVYVAPYPQQPVQGGGP